MEFSTRFKQLRDNKGWTQDDVAAMLNSSRSTIAGYESPKKRRIPDVEKLSEIAKLFNVSIDYLLGREIDLLDLLESSHTELTVGGRPLTPEERVKILAIINKTEKSLVKKINLSDIKLSAANKEGEEVLVEPSPELRTVIEKVFDELLEKRQKQ